MATSVALVGDYSADVIAHQAIPPALERASTELNLHSTWEWIATRVIEDAPRQLERFDAIWVVPASPYENMAGALAAIRFARESGRPFLGTCGGFQHAVIEFARNVARLMDADHAETNPHAPTAVIAPLACALKEKTGDIRLAPDSLLHLAYGRPIINEGYHCSYGVNPAFRTALEHAGLRFTAYAAAYPQTPFAPNESAIRGAELPPATHPFFVGTLFQPERAALRDVTPPLVRAFLAAAARRQDPT